jgi:hypothetical protein
LKPIAGSAREACAMSLKIKCTAGIDSYRADLPQDHPLYFTNDSPDYTSRKIALCLCSNRVTPGNQDLHQDSKSSNPAKTPDREDRGEALNQGSESS